MFKGFEVQYPEYEVITPHTGKSYTVRSLNVQDEEKLKGSLVTPTKVAEHLNNCIYSSLISKPKEIDSMDTFLRYTTLKDRDALLYGLYHISYEEIRNYEITCANCGKQHPVTVKASSTFNFKPYPDSKQILSKTERVELPGLKGVVAYIKQPTLFDEINNIKLLANRPGNSLELITETLIIDRFEETPQDSKEAITYNDRVDIMDAYLQLTAKDKRAIYQTYEQSFGSYGIELKMSSICPSCSHQAIYDIDLVESFFRALFSA